MIVRTAIISIFTLKADIKAILPVYMYAHMIKRIHRNHKKQSEMKNTISEMKTTLEGTGSMKHRTESAIWKTREKKILNKSSKNKRKKN